MNLRWILLAALSLALVAVDARAQVASVNYYGPDCGVNGPAFNVIGLPRLGATVQLETNSSTLFNRRPAADVWLVLGTSDQQVGGATLPIPLSILHPLYCGAILQSSEIWLAMPRVAFPPATLVQVPIVVPNDPRLVGMDVFAQSLLLSRCVGYCGPGLSTFLAASRGARMRIGT